LDKAKKLKLDMRNLKIFVRGKVQGVWFRVNAKRMADKLNLSGFVRNEQDASVYIEVSGEDIKIAEFILWLQDGPELAVVESVTIMKNEIVFESDFNIR
jgi:acylphosphatase